MIFNINSTRGHTGSLLVVTIISTPVRMKLLPPNKCMNHNLETGNAEGRQQKAKPADDLGRKCNFEMVSSDFYLMKFRILYKRSDDFYQCWECS